MDVLDNKTDEQLYATLLAEVAKARNELNCARTDLQKSHTRLNFLIVLANELINRGKDK